MACPSATQCTATDNVGNEVTFNPTSATPNSTPHPISSGYELGAVACPTTTQCTAVNLNGDGFEVTFDPTSATPISTPAYIDFGQTMLAVACPSTTQCTEVDQNGENVTFDPTSATPNSTPTPINGAGQLFDVSCPSTNECVAVDSNGNEFIGTPAASPTLSVSAPDLGTAGTAIDPSSISAVLSGGSSPSGTVAFKVFGPQSSPPSDCSGGTTVGTASVSGENAYNPSAGFTPSQRG